ncbi:MULTISPECIES: hypothetical protein [Actinomycetes]|nr:MULTISPECIES: hypothetical protein [Actinomycetes]
MGGAPVGGAAGAAGAGALGATGPPVWLTAAAGEVALDVSGAW